MSLDSLTDPGPGDQPESQGRLMCRYCGRWYRSLGHHLRPAHGISPGQYRAEFELPATRALLATDLREALTDRARHRVATDPELRRKLLEQSPSVRLEELAKARRVKADTAQRAGVRRVKREVGRRLGQHSARRGAEVRDAMDGLAVGLGYQDLRCLLQATVHLSHSGLGRLLRCSAARARFWRLDHGIVSQYRQHRSERAAAVRHAMLASVPPGQQPQSQTGLLCLECGRWWKNLGQHVARSHDLAPDDYRHRHQLPRQERLVSADLHRAWAESAGRDRAAALTRAVRARSEAVRVRYDTVAGQHGYRSVAALLAAKPGSAEAALLLGVSVGQVARLRRRYRA